MKYDTLIILTTLAVCWGIGGYKLLCLLIQAELKKIKDRGHF